MPGLRVRSFVLQVFPPSEADSPMTARSVDSNNSSTHAPKSRVVSSQARSLLSHHLMNAMLSKRANH